MCLGVPPPLVKKSKGHGIEVNLVKYNRQRVFLVDVAKENLVKYEIIPQSYDRHQTHL